MFEMKTLTLNGKTYDSFADKTARKDLEQLKQNGVTNEQVTNAVNQYLETHPVSGLTSTEKNLLLSLLRKAVYTDNMSATIAQLENLWAGGEEPDIPVDPDIPDIPDEPDVPVVTKYTITNELVNVKSSNSTSSVNEGASYTATLTADDGYEISNVTVTMGGADVTASVYANGVINIGSVTGNIEIVASAEMAEQKPAELPADGMADFFDFRNITTGATPNGGYGVTNGSNGGYLYSWAGGANGVTTDDYGFKANVALTYAGEKLGQNVTVCTLSYRGDGYAHNMYGWSKHIVSSNNGTIVKPAALNSSGGATYGTQTNVYGNNGYNVFVISISETEMKVYINGALEFTQKAADITDFASWVNEVTLQSGYAQSNGVAAAIYNKTLSQEEIVEVGAYFKTLEVA